MKRVVLLLALAFLLVPTVALADAVLDFNIAPPAGGSISYDGQGGPLVGSGIGVATVTGMGTPQNDGVTLDIVGGILNFTTGPLTGWSTNPLNYWTFGGGANSFISITGGCLTADGAPGPDCSEEGWLLYGRFGDATVLAEGSTFKIAGASFWDYKCLALLNFYGLGPTSTWGPLPGNFNISFNASGLPPAGFTGVMDEGGSGDVQNTVPEPGTLALLGTGLLSIAGLVRRKLTS